jgi:hypothetical protein
MSVAKVNKYGENLSMYMIIYILFDVSFYIPFHHISTNNIVYVILHPESGYARQLAGFQLLQIIT